ncbi:membrane protein [Burkholderia sp. THE68]|nr:membrane protein [Burkholderia sp. THE68]
MKRTPYSVLAHRSRTLRIIAMSMALAMPFAALHPAPAQAQTQSAAKLTNQQLDALTAPVALYPDALLAQVLMATTYPSDVTAAAEWSKANPNIKGDDAVKAVQSEPWDPSVQSLVAFPQALATMASKIDWVTQLGNAFIAQPSDVMDSVQRLRRAAQSAGNLKTTEQQKVTSAPAPAGSTTASTTVIQIEPANPQVVYVPTYNPTVVYGTWPYPAYPPVYVPPPPGYAMASAFVGGLAFGAGVAVANSLWGGCDWNRGDVNVNVNRYNNVNVNNRISSNTNNMRWNRNDPQFNRTNVANRQNTLNNANRGANANQFRGREDARAQAAQTLQKRTGQNLNESASQRVQGIRQGGGEKALNNSDLRQRSQNVNRDNALRGAGDGNGARQDMQRGQASRQSFANQSHERVGGGGGGVQRQGGGGGGGGFGGGGGGIQHQGGFGGGGGGGGHRGGGGGGGFHRR